MTNGSLTERRYRGGMRRPAAPVALAWAATLAGLVSIVSALTPELADRVRLVGGVLPPGVPDAARTVALSLGLAMVFLSRGLARRKRRAGALARVPLLASAAPPPAEGLGGGGAAVYPPLPGALLPAR